ncbi:MAG: flagellar M-ring protein FliF C-terminal domain-containing protein [Kofleriaceae bacterium]
MPSELIRGERAATATSLGGQLAALWSRQPWRRRFFAAAMLVALGAAVGWVVLSARPAPWVAIVTAHHEDEGRECVIALQRDGIATRRRGREIEVAPREVERARGVLAAAGLPDAGAGLRAFQDAPLMQSGFAEQVTYQRALQDELARSIKSLAPIDGARVHLALGRRSLFKGQEQRPSASVAVHIRPGQPLTAAQIQGIARLVANSVDGLRTEDVAVIDQRGASLEGEDDAAAQSELEQRVAAKVRDLLERVVGGARVAVAVSAELEPRGADDTVAEEARGEASPEATLGISSERASTASAAPTTGPAAPPRAGGAEASAPTTAAPRAAPERTGRPAARVRRLLLAVAIDARRGRDGGLGRPTDAELAQWTRLVRVAAGIDERRGDRLEVAATPFAEPGAVREAQAAAAPRPGPWLELAGAGAAAVFALGLALVAWQRRRHARALRAVEQRLAALMTQRDAAEPAEALDGGGPQAVERAVELIRVDLDASAAVLAAWLNEGTSAAEARPTSSTAAARGTPS